MMNSRKDQGRLTTADVAATGEHPDEIRVDPKAPPPRDDPRWTGPYKDAPPRDARLDRPQLPINGEDERPALLPDDRLGDLRHRWDEIQTAFVDEPRQAVERADRLVAETITQLAESFATQRTNLEHQWDRGDEVSTEELRQLLRRYRSFFDRLLTV
jgi:hypothetical protein